MPGLNIGSTVFFIVSAIVQSAHSLQYIDLEMLAIPCVNLEEKYRCAGNRSLLSQYERGCECDPACNAYGDCCVNAHRRDTPPKPFMRDRMTCLQNRANMEWDVFAVSDCPSNWVGPPPIRCKCEGPLDLSDPLNAAPVTNEAQGVTYRNRYCAECNGADMENLMTFQLKMFCAESDYLTNEYIFANLRYNCSQGVWGIDRWNTSRNATDFLTCRIFFDVPDYLNNVRFCDSDLISSCPPDYAREFIRRACGEYTAVVYYDTQRYRNPHCAICNERTVGDLSCTLEGIDGRKRPVPPTVLLDFNMGDGDQVGMRRVSRNYKYDPFFKGCRRLDSTPYSAIP